jgi:hypothetical protein
MSKSNFYDYDFWYNHGRRDARDGRDPWIKRPVVAEEFKDCPEEMNAYMEGYNKTKLEMLISGDSPTKDEVWREILPFHKRPKTRTKL